MPQPGRILAAALAALLAFALPAASGERTVTSRDVRGVVELFTSQGCASCPPADAVLAALARDPTLLALSYHVDYWDYIGWRDTHGSRENSDRQRAYAEALRSGSVYTPQVVVNGRRNVPGTKEAKIRAAVTATTLAEPTAAASAPVVTLAIRGERLHIALSGPKEARAPAQPPPMLVLVTFAPWSETAIDRGENRGRTLGSTNAVLSWRILGLWERPMAVDIPLATLQEDGRTVGCAALLQAMTPENGPGPILAAAALVP